MPTKHRKVKVQPMQHKWPLKNLNLRKLISANGYGRYKLCLGNLLKKGSTILDLGMGHSEFVAKARDNGINAYGIDAESLSNEFKWHRKEPAKKSTSYVYTAIAQELPFKDNTFNTTVSLMGLYSIRTVLLSKKRF